MKKIVLISLLVSRLCIINAAQQANEFDFMDDNLIAQLDAINLNEQAEEEQQIPVVPIGSIQQLLDEGRVFNIINGELDFELDLSNQNITSLIGLNRIPNIETVTHLILHNNRLERLEPGIFDRLQALQYLILNNNRLERLEPGIFDRLRALQYLYLNNNRLERLELGIFANLQELQKLNLSFNGLERLEPGTFDNLQALEDLNLSCNRLIRLESGLFINTQALRYLDFSNNHIEQIDLEVFVEGLLPHVRNLIFSNNRIEFIDVPLFTTISYISSLDFSFNRLREDNIIEIQNFPQLHGIRYLFKDGQRPLPSTTGRYTKAALRETRVLEEVLQLDQKTDEEATLRNDKTFVENLEFDQKADEQTDEEDDVTEEESVTK